MTSGCVRASGGKRNPSKGSFWLCVCVTVRSCVRTCDQECVYVWEEGILPAVFFPEPLPVSPPPLCIQFSKLASEGLAYTRSNPPEDTEERSQCFSTSLCVFPSSVSFHHSLNVTVNPSLHTHHIPTSLHPVCWCISYDLAEVNHAYALASTGMCLLRVLAVFSA